MTRTWEAVDATEPAYDTMMEQFGNIKNYNVISGCGVTYDAANMTLDIAAGSITHNGAVVSVAGGANALTLVADGSNPRWSWVAIDSAGAAVLVSGTAAADPAVPELGDYVELGLVKIEAAQTLANSIATKLDKRIFFPSAASTNEITSTSTQAVTSSTTLVLHSELRLSVAASTTYTWEAIIAYTAGTTGDIKVAWDIPASATNYAILYGQDVSVAAFDQVEGDNETETWDGAGTTAPRVIKATGVLVTAGTAGYLQLQFAQAVSNGTATTVLTKSKMWIN